MRPVDKSLFQSNKKVYNNYGDAKPDLIAAIGGYCSFCERHGFSSALDVEHIEHKDKHPDKEKLWDNFLIACKNCNSIKGTKDIDYSRIILPHIDNTYFPFQYLESGYIKIKDDVKESEKAKALVDLVGLDRRPGHPMYSTKDNRWQERKKVWELSRKYHNKLTQNKCDIETIIDLALKSGFWTIWMFAFNEFPEVQKELILNFKGTRQSCFQKIMDYQ